jgi:hypothetical protein
LSVRRKRGSIGVVRRGVGGRNDFA